MPDSPNSFAQHPCEHLLVGVSGSIHCMQIHSYLLGFRSSFAAQIKVIMTYSATRMVVPQTLELYTDDRVFVDPWDSSTSVHAPHIQLTRWADLFVVLPATANVLGKAAHGIADSLLTTAILSSPKPVVFVPAMNPGMWNSKAVQRNVETLKADGHQVIEPSVGVSVTSGEWDQGLGPTPELVMQHLMHLRMKTLRSEYWTDATREAPKSPSEWKPDEVREAALAKVRERIRSGPAKELTITDGVAANARDLTA